MGQDRAGLWVLHDVDLYVPLGERCSTAHRLLPPHGQQGLHSLINHLTALLREHLSLYVGKQGYVSRARAAYFR